MRAGSDNIIRPENFKTELRAAETMADFLRVCSKYYDFDNAKLGPIAKQTLINNIGSVISLSGAKPKK